MGSCCSNLDDLTLSNTLQFSFQGQAIEAKVLDVYDGDTITVGFYLKKIPFQAQCRLFGIDSPEIRSSSVEEKKAGNEAKVYLKNRILGRNVMIKCDTHKDKYGRALLGTIFLEGKDINQEMVDKGYVKPYFGGKKEGQ